MQVETIIMHTLQTRNPRLREARSLPESQDVAQEVAKAIAELGLKPGAAAWCHATGGAYGPALHTVQSHPIAISNKEFVYF